MLFTNTEAIPHCECGGRLRPNVVLYGENLPEETVNKAIEAIESADCLIVLGTSLAVYPAAGLIDNFHGKYIVVINKGKLEKNVHADVFIDDDMNVIFSNLKL